ncbi:MAG TPA: hypothetical protein PLY47_02050, partial [Rhodoglobus sp.]|nr:hypothetical protein [Rhodoglobus sp.]
MAAHQRRNFAFLVVDGATFAFAISLLSETTIIPAFVQTLTGSTLLVGLVAAVYAVGHYLPQVVGAHLVRGRTRRKPLLLAIVVALFVLRKANSSPLRLLNQAVYPIAVALLLALPVISSDSDVAAGIIDVLTQASFAVIALAGWCSMASAVRSVPFAATFVFP